ncbi:hypothetical protein Chor_004977 [Crotalus horridus]
MVSRSETDLLSIRAEFKRRYGVSLYSFIEVKPRVVLGGGKGMLQTPGGTCSPPGTMGRTLPPSQASTPIYSHDALTRKALSEVPL